MVASVLEELQAWYTRHCDGVWEHRYGISIGNIDNPGWALTIDLNGTVLEQAIFAELKEDFGDDNKWVICQKEGSQFTCNGGPMQLSRMIQIFLEWANATETTDTDLDRKRPA